MAKRKIKMKLYLILIFTLPLFFQACKKESPVEPPSKEDENFWEFKGEPDKIIRSMEICSNGNIVAECPGQIILSTDDGETWNVILSTSTEGPVAIGTHDEIYIAGNSNVWHSYDYGDKWNKSEIKFLSSDSTESGVIISCITIDNNGNVYIGTTSGVFRSKDKGKNWLRLVKGMGIEDISSILVSSSNMIFAAANSNTNGIYISTDKGENWRDVNTSAMKGQLFLTLAEDSLGNLYAGGSDRILFSNDNGSTWQTITYASSFFTDILIDKNNNIYSGLADGGMFMLKYGDSTWVEKSDGLKELVGIRSLLLDKDGYLFAGTDGIGIYKSKKSVY